MIPQDEEEYTYLGRGEATPPAQFQKNPYEEDCGCKKNKGKQSAPQDYPYSDILPKDEAYIDFLKFKELVPTHMRYLFDRVNSLSSLIHTMNSAYAEEIVVEEMKAIRNAVDGLEKAFNNLGSCIQAREQAAREAMKQDGAWVRVSK